MKGRERFRKAERLKRGSDIFSVLQKGSVLKSFPVILYLQQADSAKPLPPFKVAVHVSKKKFRRAFARNRIKRLLREAYRRNKCILTAQPNQQWWLFFLFVDKSAPSYHRVENALKQLLHMANQKIMEVSDPNENIR